MKRKKVAIIIPPRIDGKWIIREEGRTRVEDKPYAPSHAAMVVALLKEYIDSIDIMIIDAQLHNLNQAQVTEKLALFDPELVLVFVSVYHLKYDAPFIDLGYPTIVTITPACVDLSEAISIHKLPPAIYLKQEREWTTLAAVKAYLLEENLSEIPGLVIKKTNGELVNTGVPVLRSMEELPMPDFNALQFSEYLKKCYEVTGKRICVIETMHGCPFRCLYCSHGNSDKKVMCKSAKQVVDEIEILVNQCHTEHLEFIDAEFSVDMARAKEICKLIIKRGLNFTWFVNNRVDLVDEELLTLMKRAGCVEIAYGIETGDPKLQKVIGKNLNLKCASENIALTKKAGIVASLFMIMGLPGEDRESIEKNIEFLSRVNPDEFAISTLFLIPGTALFQKMKDEGKYVEVSWDKIRKNNKLQFHHDFYNDMDGINKAARYVRKRVLRNLSLSDKTKPLLGRALCFLGSICYHEHFRTYFPKLYYGLINYYKYR